MLIDSLKQIIESQKERLSDKDSGLRREALSSLPDLASHALILSGIRRCGKSTLLNQLLKDRYKEAFYLNFEDTRLYDFERNDFSRLDEIIKEEGNRILFFDEIQIVPEWERYIRQKLDEGYQMVITGSNASLLSRELGTKLTGRHISKELFPFSYKEYCSFLNLKPSSESLQGYMETGGFPEYVKTGSAEILNQLFEDILLRDIAVRYAIRNVRTLQRLAGFLISNVSKPVTGNKLKTPLDIASTNTVLEYFSYLESSWLLHFIPRFNNSIKRQMINPRKVYAIDTGLVKVNSGSFSDDLGRIFENLVFLHLRRRTKDIYYFSEKKECDFLSFGNGKPLMAIQACYHLTSDNFDRELAGLIEAMVAVNLKEGWIISLNQKDNINREGLKINVMPCHEFMSLEF